LEIISEKEIERKNMKISIITVLNTVNYGSVLQTLATQNFWEKLGYEVEFVDYMRPDQTLGGRISQKLHSRPKGLKKTLKWPVRTMIEIISTTLSYKVFRSFIKENIKLTNRIYTSFGELQQAVPEADVYCTGSDQMWNSIWNQGIEHSFFLEYAPVGKKRIAFSTSIGKTEFEEKEATQIVPLIKKYDLITLREQSAVDLLRKYGISSTCILDPTLLMSKEQWQEYIPAPNKYGKYLLVYQLHNEHDNANFDEAVKEIAASKDLQIIRIAYSYSDRKIGKKIVMPSIVEFLSLIHHAEYIVTDSFHGTAFSINLNRPFSVVYPAHFSTRMDNILELTGLKDRRYQKGSPVEKISEAPDFSEANKELEAMRKSTREIFDKFS